MKKVLAIYDLEGTILSLRSGDPLPKEPVGVPFLWVDVPEGKYIESIDPITNEPIFADIPPSETQVLREEVVSLNQQLLDIYEMLILGGI